MFKKVYDRCISVAVGCGRRVLVWGASVGTAVYVGVQDAAAQVTDTAETFNTALGTEMDGNEPYLWDAAEKGIPFLIIGIVIGLIIKSLRKVAK